MPFFRLALLPFFAGCSPGPRCAVESALNAWHQLLTPTHAPKWRAVDPPVPALCPVNLREGASIALSLEGADPARSSSISRRSQLRTNRVRTLTTAVSFLGKGQHVTDLDPAMFAAR